MSLNWNAIHITEQRDDDLFGDRSKTHGVIAGLVPAISIRMALCHTIGMAGTSPAMTKWDH